MNTSLAGPSAIAASGTATYYLPLILTFFGQDGHFPLNAMNGYINFRFFFRPSVESGTGTLNCVSMNLHAMVHDIPHHEKADIKEIYHSNHYEFDYLDVIDVSFPNQTVTAGTQNTFRLTALSNATVPFMMGTL